MREHVHTCGLCTEDYDCKNCGMELLCRDCKVRMDALQPAAQEIIETLMKRIDKLEDRGME